MTRNEIREWVQLSLSHFTDQPIDDTTPLSHLDSTMVNALLLHGEQHYEIQITNAKETLQTVNDLIDLIMLRSDIRDVSLSRSERQLLITALHDSRQNALKQINSMQESRIPQIFERMRYHANRAAMLVKKLVELAQ